MANKYVTPITNNLPIYIYIHICTINNWLDVFTNLIMNIKKSGLYDIIREIRCFCLSTLDKFPEIFNDKKIIIVKQNPRFELYERFTLNNLYEKLRDRFI